MTSRIPCEFFLIRYVPDVVKGEFVNIGVLLREMPNSSTRPPETTSPPRTQAIFTHDWHRVRLIDPAADIDLLKSFGEDIASELVAETLDPFTSKSLLQLFLSDTLSNSIQITESRPTVAESFELELEQLMRLYVESA